MGSQLYIAEVVGDLRILDLSHSLVTTLLDGGPAVAQPVALAASDGGLLVGNDGASVFLLNGFAGPGLELTPGFGDGSQLWEGLVWLGGNAAIAVRDSTCFYALDLSRGQTPLPIFGNALCAAGYRDGPLSQALFDLDNNPQSLALDPKRQRLYVADSVNNAVRVIDLDAGQVSTLGVFDGGSADRDGPAASANFVHPIALATDAAGDLFVVETANPDTVREVSWVDGGQVVRTIYDDHACSSAGGLGGPSGLAASPDGSVLYLSDQTNNALLSLTGF